MQSHQIDQTHPQPLLISSSTDLYPGNISRVVHQLQRTQSVVHCKLLHYYFHLKWVNTWLVWWHHQSSTARLSSSDSFRGDFIIRKLQHSRGSITGVLARNGKGRKDRNFYTNGVVCARTCCCVLCKQFHRVHNFEPKSLPIWQRMSDSIISWSSRIAVMM